MIIVTGAAGFIGSCLVNKLNNKGFHSIVAVDEFSREDKRKNLSGKSIAASVHRDDFFSWLDEHHQDVQAFYHLGARTDTTETDTALLDRLNLAYSKQVFRSCSLYSIPLLYASSAATYGDGTRGYDDRHDLVGLLEPLNAYGVSKNDFDRWVLQQTVTPPWWAGMKFFNVFGPNEYHKGRMASVILHAWKQLKETGGMTLFRSHRPDYRDGEQQRDFIYVKDVVAVLLFMMTAKPEAGIYNLGTGTARSFNDLARAVFAASGLSPSIRYIDTPLDIRDKYQYYTKAEMEKLKKAGYTPSFFTLEEAVRDYVQTYLETGTYY